MSLRRRLGTLLLAFALAPAMATTIAEPATALGSCNDSTSDRYAEWYDGKSAGYLYDRLFGYGPRIPGLPVYTPQGMTVWPRWNGGTDALLLIGAYDYPNRSRIYGVSLRTGELVGTVEVPESHMGGMAIVDGWLFAQGGGANDHELQPVMRFRLSDLRRAMKASGMPFLAPAAQHQRIYGGSFYSAYAGQLWAGRYEFDSDRMYRYDVSSSGWLTRVGGSYKVPPRTQGLVVTGERFIFSTSDRETRGRMYVVKRTPNYETSPGRCFTIPSLAEGIAAHNGTLYMTSRAPRASSSASRATRSRARTRRRCPSWRSAEVLHVASDDGRHLATASSDAAERPA